MSTSEFKLHCPDEPAQPLAEGLEPISLSQDAFSAFVNALDRPAEKKIKRSSVRSCIMPFKWFSEVPARKNLTSRN